MTLLPSHCEVSYQGENNRLIYYGIHIKLLPEIYSWAWLEQPDNDQAILEALPRLQESLDSLQERLKELDSQFSI